MRKIIPIAVVVLILGAPDVMAQSKNGTSRSANPPPPATMDRGSIPEAPIGHRQPRADQVPSLEEKGYVESAEDKALDRKIKSICRGC